MVALAFCLFLGVPGSAPASEPASQPAEPREVRDAILFGQGHKVLRLWRDNLEGAQADAERKILFTTPIDPLRRYYLGGSGAALAIGDDDLRVVEVASGKIRGTLAGHFAAPFFSSDRHLAALTTPQAVDGHWRVTVISLKDGKAVGEIDVGNKQPLGFAASSDHTHAVVVGEDALASLWQLPNGKPIELKSHRGAVLGAIISANGMRVLTCGADKKARLWDSKTGHLINTITDSEAIRSVAFSPDGKSVYSAGGSGVRIWDVFGPLKKKLSTSKNQTIVGLFEAGKTLTTTTPEEAFFYDTKTGKLSRQLQGHLSSTGAISVETDRVVTVFNGQAPLWNYSTGARLSNP